MLRARVKKREARYASHCDRVRVASVGFYCAQLIHARLSNNIYLACANGDMLRCRSCTSDSLDIFLALQAPGSREYLASAAGSLADDLLLPVGTQHWDQGLGSSSTSPGCFVSTLRASGEASEATCEALRRSRSDYRHTDATYSPVLASLWSGLPGFREEVRDIYSVPAISQQGSCISDFRIGRGIERHDQGFSQAGTTDESLSPCPTRAPNTDQFFSP